MSYPHKWRDLRDEEQLPKALLTKDSDYGDLVSTEDGMLKICRKFIQEDFNLKVYNLNVRDDDVWVITYPKCGTTWTQEIVWSIVHKLDPEQRDKTLFLRSPFLEMEAFWPKKPSEWDDSNDFIRSMYHTMRVTEELKSPRVIKSHLPLSHLPQDLLNKAKVVFVARDPRDVAASYYHHCKLFSIDFPTIEEFTDHFMKGNLGYGDYSRYLQVEFLENQLD